MVLSIFKRGRKQTASGDRRSNVIDNHLSPSQSPDKRSRSRSFSSQTQSPLQSPSISQSEWSTPLPSPITEHTLTLRVVVDPILNGKASHLLGTGIFTIQLDPDDYVESVRAAVAKELKIEDAGCVGCFKVNIPNVAYEQAKTYNSRYGVRVDLISHFPAYNLFDPDQLQAALPSHTPSYDPRGNRFLSMSPQGAGQRIGDWWPDGEEVKENGIGLLVRIASDKVDEESPVTLLAHFAKPPIPSRPGSSCSPISMSPQLGHIDHEAPYPPVAVEVSPSTTLNDLKAKLLKEDGRPVGLLNKIVMWRVDMSWKEMLNCEAFGGLRDGSMPWPYPPTAPEPVQLKGSETKVSSFFPGHRSNPNLVSIYVWIPPSALEILTRAHQPHSATSSSKPRRWAPTFSYPFIMPPLSPAESESEDDTHLVRSPSGGSATEKSTTDSRGRKASSRPNTAPGAMQPSEGGSPGVPAFGKKPRPSATRARSRVDRPSLLQTATPVTANGLGLGLDSLAINHSGDSRPALGLQIGHFSRNGSVASECTSTLSGGTSVDNLLTPTLEENLEAMFITGSKKAFDKLGIPVDSRAPGVVKL